MTYTYFAADERTPRSLITSTAIGEFRRDPRNLVERHFDIHLAVSPWGSREVVVRLPKGGLEPSTVQRYGAEAWVAGEYCLVAFRTDFADPRPRTDFLLHRLESVRAGLAAGDRRALYLGWLALLGNPDQYSAGELVELEEEREPPVPPGLAAADPGLGLLGEILCVDQRLLAVAAAPGRPQLRRSVAALLRAAAGPHHRSRQAV
ncbi:hypothetical protein ABT095_21260 [Kitasatospora sp. NPDC002227]|uniref:hypothetical protein n=1 Tax=Kitasatospora sp. NPDC002227 TaxID=3154773 RepID=UPI00331C019D